MMPVANKTPYGPALAERRYLTILFADLVGYTALSERLDPELLRDLQLGYQQVGLAVADRYRGFVAAYSGDGILVYFGYPSAHENDAERGVRAALEFVERTRALDVSAYGANLAPLAVRVAVHTGLAVIGPETASMGRSEPGAVGEAVNIAARLQAEAEPNTVVVSGVTLELVDGLFDSKPLGPRLIRGLSRSIQVHRILGARPGAGRTLARWHRGAVKMIGRQEALDRLTAQWQAVTRESRCRVVHVVGEAGVGKSRLVLELCYALGLPDAQILQANCLDTFASTPLYPAACSLWSGIGIRADDNQSTKRDKIAAFLGDCGLNSPEAVDTLASLLGLALSGAPEPMPPPPFEVKRRQFELIIGVIEHLATVAPSLLWVEDAHWLDPSSAELLPQLIQRLQNLPLLVALTRRSFPTGPELPDADELIRLEPLPPPDCLALARAVPGANAISQRILSEAVAAAEGVPLFVEQLVISLVGQARDPTRSAGPGPLVLPLTLAEMLSEQLDRLEGSRRIVQAAACIGRAFTPSSLAALLGEDEADVQQLLEALADAEIVRRQPDGAGGTEYEFRHALLQRVAYESMLQVDRRATHARIIGLLRSGEDLGPVLPEVVAHHLTSAGDIEAAIRSWLDAGMRAARRSAHVEALDHLARGLGLLEQIRDPTVRRDLDIKLQAARIGSISATAGPPSAEMSACCRHGLELCLDGEFSPVVFLFLYGQTIFLRSQGRIDETLRLSKLALSLAEHNGYRPGRVIGHRLLGTAYLAIGDLRRVREEVERSLQLYEPEQDAAETHLYGHNAQIHSQALLSLALFCLGEVDAAFRIGLDAMQAADELHHPHSQAIAFGYVGGWVSGFSGASDLLMQGSRRLVRLSEQHQLGIFRHIGEAFLGWALSQQGSLDQAIAMLEQAMTGLAAAKSRLAEVGSLTILADAKRRRGRLEEAKALADRAVASVRVIDRWLEPEVLRVAALVAGETKPGDPDPAVALLRQAVASARRLGSPIFELRCLESLAGLGGAQERRAAETRIGELAAFQGLDRRLRQAMQRR